MKTAKTTARPAPSAPAIENETVRTTITMPLQVREAATRLMKERMFSDFSGFLSQLIREELERRKLTD